VDHAGDPASPLCEALADAGFAEIALSRRAILTGKVQPNFDASRLEIALAGLPLIDRVGERMRRELVARAEHQARVFICGRLSGAQFAYASLRRRGLQARAS